MNGNNLSVTVANKPLFLTIGVTFWSVRLAAFLFYRVLQTKEDKCAFVLVRHDVGACASLPSSPTVCYNKDAAPTVCCTPRWAGALPALLPGQRSSRAFMSSLSVVCPRCFALKIRKQCGALLRTLRLEDTGAPCVALRMRCARVFRVVVSNKTHAMSKRLHALHA